MVTLTAITPVGPDTPAAWLEEMRDSLIDGNRRLDISINYVCSADMAPVVKASARAQDKVIVSESRNVARRRNLGLEQADGRYVAQFDSDDVHVHGSATELVNILDAAPTLTAAYGVALDVSPDLKPLYFPRPEARVWTLGELEAYRKAHIPQRPPLGFYPMLGGAGIMRRDAIGEGWDESGSGRFYEENDLIQRLASRGGVATTDRLTLLYRRHDKSLTRTRTDEDVDHALQIFKSTQRSH